MVQVVKGFPGVVRVRVSEPFDKILRFVSIGSLVKNGFDFVFVHSFKKDRRRSGRNIGKGSRGDVRLEPGYVENWVHGERRWQVELVCYLSNSFTDGEGAFIAGVELGGRPLFVKVKGGNCSE